MANATIASQVQALYVGYLGRAADQAGLDFWANAIEAGTSTIQSVALGFTLSAEYTALYAGKTNEELAAAIYENVLGRAADADGLAFWVGELAKGVQTPETLLAAMLNSLGAVDQQTIANKVIVANAYTVAAGVEYDVKEGAAIIANVNHTPSSVAAALGQIEALTFSVPTTLAALAQAQKALADFLASVDLDDDADTDTTADQIKALIDADAVAGNPVKDFNDNFYSSANLSNTSTAAQQSSAFSAARANAQNFVDTKQAVVDAAQVEVNKLDKTKVATYLNAVAAELVTDAAATAALIKEAGAQGEYNAQNADVDTSIVSVLLDGTVSIDDGLLKDLVVIDTAGAIDVLKLATGVTEKTNPGITALLAAVNARVSAEVADLKAEDAIAKAEVALGTGLATVEALVSAKEDLQNAKDAATALEDLISEVKDAYTLNGQLTALESKLDAAEKVLTDAGYNVDDLADGVGTATDANDVFVFGGKAAVIGGTFSADDILYVGSGYKLVVLGEKDDILTKNVGDVNALEVFYDSAAGKLYVEAQPFAGSATGDADLITITGLPTGAELTFNGGFLQLA